MIQNKSPSIDGRPPDIGTLVQDLLGVDLGQLRLLPERVVADAAGLVARHAGPSAALALLDALQEGEESLTLADERTRLLLEAGRHEEAVANARVRRERKDSLLAQSELARDLLNARAVDEAVALAAGMVSQAPEALRSLYVAGLVALARHRIDEARACFEKVLELYNSPLGLRGLARIAQVQGDAATALDLAEQALDQYPEAPPDLVRELLFYADRLPDSDAAARARRRAEAALSALDEAVRGRVAAALDRARERAAGRSRPHEELPDEPPEVGPVAALPAAPPPEPDLAGQLQGVLREVFGYREFRAGQLEVIASVLSGHDTLAVMPTGAGKSLCYQLPAVLSDGATLVVSPLIALMKDQVESLPPSLATQATLVNSSLESAELLLRLGAIAAGYSRLIYAAPERLRQRPFIHALARAGIRLVVIDEAHCLSMWGHDFRPDYLHIRDALGDLGNPRVLAMTATATPEMMVEIGQQLGRELQVVNTGVLRDNLFLIARRAENDDHKLRLLLPFVQRRRGSGIIYVNSRESAEKLERQLRRSGINARAYHAGMGPAERTTLQDRFMSGQVQVMVATVAFGMGVDKPDVRFIVHYHPARSLESYTQESGRAGRDGQPATCLVLHSSADRSNLTRWSNEAAVEIEVLRAVYRVLRGLTRGGQELVDEGALRERLEDDGFAEVDLRVAISLLESAALLRRGPDVPRGATVTLRADAAAHADDDLWAPFVRAARLEVERSAPVDLQDVARRLATLPGHAALNAVALEDHLLDWQDEQRLTYRGIGRDMLIEMLPPPADAAERMASILDALGRRNRRRLRSLLAYLDTQRCRHAFIGRHFGQHSPDRCERCDNCRPVELEEMRPAHGQKIDDPGEAALRLVGQMPWTLGRTGVIEVLKGVAVRRLYAGRTELYGSLAHLSKAAIERAVDRLIEEGDLVAEVHDGYRLLGPAAPTAEAGPHGD